MWISNKVKDLWHSMENIRGSKMFVLQQKLKKLNVELKEWNKSTFGNVFQCNRDLEMKKTETREKIMDSGKMDNFIPKKLNSWNIWIHKHGKRKFSGGKNPK
jgi:hypothetical protein